MFFSSELVYSGAFDIHFGQGCPWVFVAGMGVGCLGGLVFGGGASPFRFGDVHVLVQHPICSFSLGLVNYINN